MTNLIYKREMPSDVSLYLSIYKTRNTRLHRSACREIPIHANLQDEKYPPAQIDTNPGDEKYPPAQIHIQINPQNEKYPPARIHTPTGKCPSTQTYKTRNTRLYKFSQIHKTRNSWQKKRLEKCLTSEH